MNDDGGGEETNCKSFLMGPPKFFLISPALPSVAGRASDLGIIENSSLELFRKGLIFFDSPINKYCRGKMGFSIKTLQALRVLTVFRSYPLPQPDSFRV